MVCENINTLIMSENVLAHYDPFAPVRLACMPELMAWDPSYPMLWQMVLRNEQRLPRIRLQKQSSIVHKYK